MLPCAALFADAAALATWWETACHGLVHDICSIFYGHVLVEVHVMGCLWVLCCHHDQTSDCQVSCQQVGSLQRPELLEWSAWAPVAPCGRLYGHIFKGCLLMVCSGPDQTICGDFPQFPFLLMSFSETHPSPGSFVKLDLKVRSPLWSGLGGIERLQLAGFL